MQIDFRRLDGHRVVALLTERYGPPHKTSTAEFSTRAGGRVSGTVHEWLGRNVSITFAEIATRVDRGHVVAVSRTWREHEAQAPIDNARQFKDNL